MAAYTPPGPVRLIYHSYDEPCEGCVFKKHTTFSSGRNLLLRRALAMEKEEGVDIRYFVFTDWDIDLVCVRAPEQRRRAPLIGGH